LIGKFSKTNTNGKKTALFSIDVLTFETKKREHKRILFF